LEIKNINWKNNQNKISNT